MSVRLPGQEQRSAPVGLRSVQVRGVTRRFERTIALRRVDLTLQPGSCTLLLGPNGAGKSTLLGILSTRLRPTRGTVLYGDVPWDRAGPDVRSQIGLVPHGSMLYGDLSASENLRFYSRLYGVRQPELRLRQVLQQVGLSDEAERPVRTFSRGMLQRASLARALLHRPALLLLDEPFTGLDRSSGHWLLDTLAVERGRGCMLVVVTHHPGPLAGLADQALLLEQGRVSQRAERLRPTERQARPLRADGDQSTKSREAAASSHDGAAAGGPRNDEQADPVAELIGRLEQQTAWRHTTLGASLTTATGEPPV